MENEELNTYLKVALEAAEKAGKVLIKYWGKKIHITEKSYAWDLVTDADKESEATIISHIKKHFPEHTILAEESGKHDARDAKHLWCIDPLDGTTNYTHHFPMISVNLALIIEGNVVLGVTYNPILQERFHAVKGKGAYLNDEKIRVSKVNTLERSLLVTGFAYDRKTTSDTNYKEFCELTNISQGVRRIGSASLDLAYVAAGRFDGYWERGLGPWDMAAGIIIVTEAGGAVNSYDLSPVDIYSGQILATNTHIHSALSEKILKARS